MFEKERIRKHRIVGPVPQHQEERHWVWAAAAIAVALIGTGISTYAASEQAAAQRRQAKSQAKARQIEAENERQAAAYEERQYRRRISLIIGKNIAASAASGIDISMGSPLFLELDNVRQAEMEALNIRRTGQVRAGALDFEASLEKQRARFAGQSQRLAIAGGVAQGASSILGGWYNYQRSGIGQSMPTQAG